MTVRRRAKKWRPIPGWPAYEVSDVGHVKRVKPGPGARVGRILRPKGRRGTHLFYDLRHDGEGQHVYAHVAVLLAFVGPKPTPKHECAHWDGNNQNNDYRNLRWATHAENEADKVRHGTANYHFASATPEQLAEWGRRGGSARRAPTMTTN